MIMPPPPLLMVVMMTTYRGHDNPSSPGYRGINALIRHMYMFQIEPWMVEDAATWIWD